MDPYSSPYTTPIIVPFPAKHQGGIRLSRATWQLLEQSDDVVAHQLGDSSSLQLPGCPKAYANAQDSNASLRREWQTRVRSFGVVPESSLGRARHSAGGVIHALKILLVDKEIGTALEGVLILAGPLPPFKEDTLGGLRKE